MKQNTQKEISSEQAKQPYTKPELTVHGAVEIETQISTGGSRSVIFVELK